jgi:hypothetical protein
MRALVQGFFTRCNREGKGMGKQVRGRVGGRGRRRRRNV